MTMTHPMPSLRAGFTVLELLIVLVVVGLLAAFILPKISETKEAAYVSAMHNDLRNYVQVQELYHTDHGTYAEAPDEADLGFSFTPDVSAVSSEADQSTYRLVVAHGKTGRECLVRGLEDRVLKGCDGDGSIESTADGMTVDFEYDSGDGDLAGNVMLNALGSPLHAAGDGELVWDFGDGTTVSGPVSTARLVSHTYDAPGDYTVIAEERDGDKVRFATADVAVEEPETANISFFDCVSSVKVGEVVDCQLDTNAEVDEVQVDWGDGDGEIITTTGTSFPLAYTYETADDYVVNVDVSRDGQTQDFTSLEVQVEEVQISSFDCVSPVQAGEQVSCQLETSGEVDEVFVSWGDGDGETITTTGTSFPLAHTYETADDYLVNVDVSRDGQTQDFTSLEVQVEE